MEIALVGVVMVLWFVSALLYLRFQRARNLGPNFESALTDLNSALAREDEQFHEFVIAAVERDQALMDSVSEMTGRLSEAVESKDRPGSIMGAKLRTGWRSFLYDSEEATHRAIAAGESLGGRSISSGLYGSHAQVGNAVMTFTDVQNVIKAGTFSAVVVPTPAGNFVRLIPPVDGPEQDSSWSKYTGVRRKSIVGGRQRRRSDCIGVTREMAAGYPEFGVSKSSESTKELTGTS